MRYVVVVLAFFAVACGDPLIVSDRHDVGRDQENVHRYSTGSVVTFTVTANRPFTDLDAIAATSSDTSVMTVLDGLGGEIQIQTLTAGTAELVFRINNEVRDSRQIVVVDPASARLSAFTFAQERDDLLPPAIELAAGQDLHVLRDRVTRLIVRTFDQSGLELFGQAVSSASVLQDGDNWFTEVAPEGPYAAMVIVPSSTAAQGTLRLDVGGVLVQEIPIVANDTADIERVLLTEGGVDYDRGLGQRSVVYARATDSRGITLFGQPGWQLEGRDVGVSFAVEYKVGFAVPGQELVARLGGVEARRTIYADPQSVAAVGSCAAAGPVNVAFLVVLGMLAACRQRPFSRSNAHTPATR